MYILGRMRPPIAHCGTPKSVSQWDNCGKNKELKQVRKDGYLAIQRDCDAEKVPSNFTRVFLRALRITLEQASHLESETIQSLSTALWTQEQIGFYNIVVGFLSGVQHPQTVTT